MNTSEDRSNKKGPKIWTLFQFIFQRTNLSNQATHHKPHHKEAVGGFAPILLKERAAMLKWRKREYSFLLWTVSLISHSASQRTLSSPHDLHSTCKPCHCKLKCITYRNNTNEVSLVIIFIPGAMIVSIVRPRRCHQRRSFVHFDPDPSIGIGRRLLA